MKKQIILAAAALMISAGVMAQTTQQTKSAPAKQATTQTTQANPAPAEKKAPVVAEKKAPVSKKKMAPKKNTEIKSATKK
jgi:hypothetical protein